MLRFRTFLVLVIFIVLFAAGTYSQSDSRSDSGPAARHFYQGRRDKIVLPADTKVYRIYGGVSTDKSAPPKDSSENQGVWYGFSPPFFAQQAKSALSLPTENETIHFDEVIIPKGTTVWVGKTKPWDFEGRPRTRGMTPQMWLAKEYEGSVDTVRSKIPVTDLQKWLSRARSLDSYLPKTYREAWAAYAKTPPRQPAGFIADRVVPQFTTNKKVISEAVRTYGTFPGGILLEADAQFSLEELRELRYDKESNTLQVNNCRYSPGLKREELAILYHFVRHSKDTKHFGAVAQNKFHGVPEDSMVTLWLNLADSELGGYAYGYDTATEIFYPPKTLAFTNPELLRLSQIAKMNLEVIAQDTIKREVFAWQPRVFLRSRNVAFRIDENTLSVERHSLDVNFQVFREVKNKSKIEYSINDAKEAEPHVAKSVKWISDNLPAVLKSSPALSRVMRYDEVLALLRYASARGINVQGANDLEAAYNQRRKIHMTSDVYAGFGADYSAHVRETSLLLESKFREERESLNPRDRLIVMMELMKLASMSSEAKQLARYRREATRLLKHAREFNKTLAVSQGYEPWVFESIDGFVQETGVRSIFSSAYYANEYLKNNNLEPALAFLSTASEACSEVMKGKIDSELYSKTCSDITAQLAQNKRAKSANATTSSTAKKVNNNPPNVLGSFFGDYAPKIEKPQAQVFITNDLGPDQLWENVTVDLNSIGPKQSFHVDVFTKRQSQVFNIETGIYCFKIWSSAAYTDGYVRHGYGDGCFNLQGGSTYAFNLARSSWNPNGYYNLVLDNMTK